MRGDTIQILMQDVVRLAQTVETDADNFRAIPKGLNKTAQHKTAFLLNYTDLAAGWKAAKMFAKAHSQLPLYLTAEDSWVWRAYLLHCNPNLYFDRHVAEAEALTDPSMQNIRNTVQALLLTEDSTMSDIARITGLHQDTLEAYEALFYNIRDREKDYLWLANQVYPGGRLEELYDQYLRNASWGDILRRTGYKCGRDYVMYMAGFRSNLIKDMSAGDMASQLEKMVMANGFVLANSGLINQRADAQGLRTAQSMITAAKAGGMEHQEQSGFDDLQVSIALRGELSKYGRSEFKANQAELRKRQETTIDVDVETVDS